MTAKPADAFDAWGTLATSGGTVELCRLGALEQAGLVRLAELPYSIRVLLENALRNVDGFAVLEEHVRTLAGWSPEAKSDREIPFQPPACDHAGLHGCAGAG
jgi:aconitate hydratase